MQAKQPTAPLRSAAPNTRLRLAREGLGLTQEAVAGQLGTNAFTVGRWERGATRPGPHYRRKLCALFGCDTAALGLTHTPVDNTPAMSDTSITIGVAAGGSPSTITLPSAAPPLAVTLMARQVIGREDDLRAIKDALLRDEPLALTAVYGLPGVGKTTLAAILAADDELRAAFPDGILWAGLGPHAQPLAQLGAWATTLGLAMECAEGTAHWQAIATLGRAIRDAIGARRMLLLLDDAWNLEDALALRVGGAACAHLLTTRFPTIARQFAPTGAYALGELDDTQSIALLTMLAPSAAAQEPEELLKLAHAVGGLPLALTLLGGYLHTQSETRQPRRLRAAFVELRQAGRRLSLAQSLAPVDTDVPDDADYAGGAMPMQQGIRSLRLALLASAAALRDDARRALHALACFPAKPNSFSEEAALAATGADAATLDALSDAGLLETAGPARYMLHQTVADFAYTELAGDAGAHANSVSARFVAYFAGYADEWRDDYTQLGAEATNISAALQLACGAQNDIPDAAHDDALNADLLRGALAFAPFLEARGLYTAAETALIPALEAARRRHDLPAQAQALLRLGRLHIWRGQLREADTRFSEAEQLARTTGDRALRCALLALRGEVALHSGDLGAAEEHLRKGLALASGQHAPREMGQLLRLLGEVADSGGHFACGDRRYLKGLLFAREAQDAETMCALLQNLGGKAVIRGEYVRGERYLLEGIALARAQGLRQRLCALLNNLGVSFQRQDRLDDAEPILQETLEVGRALGQPLRIIRALNNLSAIERERERFDLAKTYAAEGLALARDAGQPFLLGECLCVRGELALRQGELRAATDFFAEALALAEQVVGHDMYVRATFGLARALAARGQLDGAWTYARLCRAHLTPENADYAREVTDWLATLPHPDPDGAAALRHASPRA